MPSGLANLRMGTPEEPATDLPLTSVDTRSASAEQDDTGTIGLVECNEVRVVEIRSDDDPLLAPRHVEHLAVSRSTESEIDGVDRIMTGSSQVWPSVGRHRHVDQELQPVSSMISSSARLAA